MIVGPRFLLRPLRVEDADGDYPSWLNDPEVCRHNSHYVFPYVREQALAYIQEARTNRSDLILAIEERETKRHVGNIALHGVSSRNGVAEFAILLGDRSSWGKGVGTEAGLLLLRHGFEAMRLHRIECGTSRTNAGMQRLALKLGMKEEGVRRAAMWKRGRYVDVVEYGVLADEFFTRFGRSDA